MFWLFVVESRRRLRAGTFCPFHGSRSGEAVRSCHQPLNCMTTSSSTILRIMRFDRILLCYSLAICAYANTEKTVFVAPPSLEIANAHPSLDNLRLGTLSPTHKSLRSVVKRTFPSVEDKKGFQSWYLLEDLTPDQRYELRVCWAATVGFYDINTPFEHRTN